MQTDSPGLRLASGIIAALRNHFGRRARNFAIHDIQENANLIAFSITFEIYDFYPLIFAYDRGFYGFAIDYGTRGITVLRDGDVPGGIDAMPAVAAELDRRVRVRIPDKYLDVYEPPPLP